jgi:hypothetical protein
MPLPVKPVETINGRIQKAYGLSLPLAIGTLIVSDISGSGELMSPPLRSPSNPRIPRRASATGQIEHQDVETSDEGSGIIQLPAFGKLRLVKQHFCQIAKPVIV